MNRRLAAALLGVVPAVSLTAALLAPAGAAPADQPVAVPVAVRTPAPIEVVVQYMPDVRIEAADTFGSGTVIGHTSSGSLVLTAAHVLVDGPVTVTSGDGKEVPTDIINCSDEMYDMCVLHTAEILPTSAATELADVAVGAEVSFAGQTAGRSMGTVAERDLVVTMEDPNGHVRGLISVAELSALSYHGDSGAGVIDSDGRLVGMNDGFRNGTSRALIVAGPLFTSTVRVLRDEVIEQASSSPPGVLNTTR